jgi:hypothetical protein
MLLGQISIEIIEPLSHVSGMLLVHAKHDGLGEAIRLLHEIRQVAGYRLRPRAECDDALKVLGMIFVVRNCAAITIKIALAWTPSRRVPCADHPMHPIGC